MNKEQMPGPEDIPDDDLHMELELFDTADRCARPEGLPTVLNVNINHNTQNQLRELQAQLGMSYTSLTRQSVEVSHRLTQEIIRGSSLYFERPDGSTAELILPDVVVPPPLSGSIDDAEPPEYEI